MNYFNSLSTEPVLVAHNKEKTISFSGVELDHQIHTLVTLLEGVEGSALAFKLDNTPTWLAFDVACARTNNVAVPIAYFFSDEQTQFIIKQCHAALFISDTPTEGVGVLVKTLTLFDLYTVYIYQCGNAGHTDFFATTQKVTFTSGSTGTPKGVCLSSTSQMRVAQSLCDAINIKQPVHLCLLPLAVLLENIAGVYAPLKSHGVVHLMPLEQLGFIESSLHNPAHLIAAIDKVQPTTLILVPELLTCLVTFAEQGWQVPTSLKFVAVGGAVVSEEMIAKARSLNLPVFQGYGLSEAGSVVSLNTPHNDDLNSAGTVLTHLKSKVENGQLFIKGDLFLGYLNQQPHDSKQWYATGDLVELTDNTLFIKGRLKNLIITSMGRNVSAEWPESLLLSNSHILQAVVFGEGKAYLSVLVFASKALSNEQLAHHINIMNLKLPDYARIKKWHRLTSPLTIQNGQLTTNNRPKRNVISQFYSSIIEQLYPCGDAINE
ncbi:AMP-binding protein [Pseudoalteromonas sp. H105]|uniref:AMP-binding protein n=1 Tax=Pseudoalteromonas sp. H105 TaxID=1348393 RepID=UPI000731F891|nr:AMP-binding protein [Pseudoalteromonas sp. H105]KTF16628.1 long-chain fatty acid--CoA ligase [Pseudoalteromonas sp. H105]